MFVLLHQRDVTSKLIVLADFEKVVDLSYSWRLMIFAGV